MIFPVAMGLVQFRVIQQSQVDVASSSALVADWPLLKHPYAITSFQTDVDPESVR